MRNLQLGVMITDSSGSNPVDDATALDVSPVFTDVVACISKNAKRTEKKTGACHLPDTIPVQFHPPNLTGTHASLSSMKAAVQILKVCSSDHISMSRCSVC